MKLDINNVEVIINNKTIISNINISVLNGCFTTLIGPSGSGKTTILKLFNGLIKPTSGSVYLDDKNIKEYDLISIRKKIGYIIQDNGLFPHLDVFHNISYVLELEKVPKKEIETRVKTLLKMVELEEDILFKMPSQLSGGQQQRVGIARGLANHPQLILLDEPFGSLDSITRKKLQKTLKRIHQEFKTTIILVTHDINEAILLSDHIIVIDKGIIIQQDSPLNLISNPINDIVKELIE